MAWVCRTSTRSARAVSIYSGEEAGRPPDVELSGGCKVTSMTDVARPQGVPDPVIDVYKEGIDRTLIRENLRRTPDERFQQLMALQAFAEELREAGRRARRR